MTLGVIFCNSQVRRLGANSLGVSKAQEQKWLPKRQQKSAFAVIQTPQSIARKYQQMRGVQLVEIREIRKISFIVTRDSKKFDKTSARDASNEI